MRAWQQRGRERKRRSVMRSTRSLRRAAARCNAWALASIGIAGCRRNLGSASCGLRTDLGSLKSSAFSISDVVTSRTQGARAAIGARGLSPMAGRLTSGKSCQPAHSRANGFSVTLQPSIPKAGAQRPNRCPRNCVTALFAKSWRSTINHKPVTINQKPPNQPNQGRHEVSLSLSANCRASLQEIRCTVSSFGAPSPRVHPNPRAGWNQIRSAHGMMEGERGLSLPPNGRQSQKRRPKTRWSK